jgi:uncharacterized protein with GYD domain
MARFAATIRFTEKGIQAIQDTIQRASAFKAAAKKLGVKVVDLYWSLGPFDGLLILDAPDSHTATAALLRLKLAPMCVHDRLGARLRHRVTDRLCLVFGRLTHGEESRAYFKTRVC